MGLSLVSAIYVSLGTSACWLGLWVYLRLQVYLGTHMSLMSVHMSGSMRPWDFRGVCVHVFMCGSVSAWITCLSTYPWNS